MAQTTGIHRDAVDRVLATAVEHGDVAGVVALATDADGELYTAASGLRAVGGSTPMTLDTVFNIASMTKPVTAVAALQLVEQGTLTLDEPVGMHLEELQRIQVLDGFDADGSPRYRAPRRAITLRHLLTHTSGFGYAAWNADLYRLEQRQRAPLGAYYELLVFDPGERWAYGTSIDWVGRLIERVTDQSLEDYFQAHVFQPLGMRETTYVLRDEQRARLAGRHQRQPDGSLQPVDGPPPAAPTAFFGGGGLYSTAPDYGRFMRMLLNGGQGLLQPASVAELARNHLGELNVEVMQSTLLERSAHVELFPGTVKKWSLGGLLNTQQVDGGRGVGSWAWGGMFNTFFWVDPERRLAGTILTQSLPFCDPRVLALLDAFERAVYSLR